MTFGRNDLHVYEREITQGERSSLSVLAGLIPEGARVLDLGTGSGALGRHLAARAAATTTATGTANTNTDTGATTTATTTTTTAAVDGLTYNEEEAARARPHYRRVEVADLEQPGWVALFEGQQYDRIVCADVLEHLRQPETALRACRSLLAPGGQVLISVPNAAYSGLVAELLDGDFRYRDEGLLDRTHLRFFTRRSLLEFLAGEGWALQRIEPITRPLTESEFRGAFHALPPAVAKYLLALPDAACYQLVAVAEPGPAAVAVPFEDVLPAPAQALFALQVYCAGEHGFTEERKVVQPGVMGRERQTIRFVLPGGEALHGLRLDPADRPGFLRMHRIALLIDDAPRWEWRCDTDGPAALEEAAHHDLMLRAPWPAGAALVLVHGDDPYLDLPIPPSALSACSAPAQAVLEVELDWPMSADYMGLVDLVAPLQAKLEAQRAQAWRELEEARAKAHGDLEALRADLQREQSAAEGLRRTLEEGHARLAEGFRADIGREQAIARELGAQAEAAQGRVSELTLQLEAAQRGAQEQDRCLAAWQQQGKELLREKNILARERSALQKELASLRERHQALTEHLRWIEQSTIFRATRPLVRAKMATERLLRRRPPAAPPPQAAVEVSLRQAPPDRPVDIIVPVYRGLADTQLCVRSVLASKCQTVWRLVIVNDASPEPEVTQWLRETSAGDDRIVLLENPQNLGFVGTVNRGMSVSNDNDVLLLNSDTEVANDWLDRLRTAAYGDQRVASVTPFSNNATICSYPLFCQPNELPPGCETAGLDALFARTNAGQVIDIPTGVGFCMYIRRDALAQVGLFDVEQFGKGYGEENDFCRRAADAGWRNLHALDTFVLHTGGVSFGDSKSQREIEAVEKLRRLHPTYDGLVQAFVQADPARAARHAVDAARIRDSGLPCVLAVLHDRGGGTRRHVHELAEHFTGRAFFLGLTPLPGAAVRLELIEPASGFRFDYSAPVHWDALLEQVRALGVCHLHYHHIVGHSDEVLHLGEQLGVSWDFTAHDYYSLCPQITLTGDTYRFCGEQGGGECRGTCSRQVAEMADWRSRHGRLVTQARHVLVPSQDTARRYARMWPASDVRVALHTDITDPVRLPRPKVQPLAADAPLRIAVLGGVSKIKGADLLESVAALARKGGLNIEFHLVGFAYRELLKQPKAALTIHGGYDEKDLPALLAWLKPDLVWFPALWPETYSYTLSACLEAGLPVVAPTLGAFGERLQGRPWSWVQPWDATPAEWLDFFEQVREKNFVPGVSPAAHDPAPASIDQRLRSWHYDLDYLEGLQQPVPAPALAPALAPAPATEPKPEPKPALR